MRRGNDPKPWLTCHLLFSGPVDTSLSYIPKNCDKYTERNSQEFLFHRFIDIYLALYMFKVSSLLV